MEGQNSGISQQGPAREQRSSSRDEQNKEFSIQNEDFPPLKRDKGGNADYSIYLHKNDKAMSLMQTQNFYMRRSAGTNFGGTSSSYRPHQQQQHAKAVSSGGVSYLPGNNQDLHGSDILPSHSAYHLIQQYESQNQSQFRLQHNSADYQSFRDQSIKSKQVAVKNEDFPPLKRDKGGNADYSIYLHKNDKAMSLMQTQNFYMRRSAGTNFGGTSSSYRPHQQQQHAKAVSSGGVSYLPGNNQDLHGSDILPSHSAYHLIQQYESQNQSQFRLQHNSADYQSFRDQSIKSKQVAVKNEDFPPLKRDKGGNADYSMYLHKNDKAMSLMQTQNFYMRRSAGTNFGGTSSSYRPHQQQQHATAVSSGGVSYSPGNNQDLHGIGSYNQLLIQQYESQNQSQFRLQHNSADYQSFRDESIKSKQATVQNEDFPPLKRDKG